MTRHSRRKTIPGLKICHTCGHIYTRRAAVCPQCHNMPDGSWARTVGVTPDAGQPCPTQPPPASLAIPNPRPHLDLSAYPLWLRKFDSATNASLMHISTLARSEKDIVRQTAHALLALRYREPIPPHVNVDDVKSEIKKWFRSHKTFSGQPVTPPPVTA